MTSIRATAAALVAGTLQVAVAGCAVRGGLPAAGDDSEPAAFVVRLGSDTVSAERFTRTATTIEGDLVVRAPRTRVSRYAATLTPDGAVTRFQIDSRPAVAGAGPAPQRVVMTFGPDTTLVQSTVGDDLNFVSVNGGAPFASRIVPRGADRFGVMYNGALFLATVDRAGRVQAWDGSQTTAKAAFERGRDADVAALAQQFAARDAAGSSLGALSPRDTVRAAVGGARLLVDYGRPSKRGREIFGGIEPWGSVWRTGANAATQLETSADLVMNGTTVPAGKYTLWTLLSLNEPMLIVNRQTGQWGTLYDPKQDRARIPLFLEKPERRLERFTIPIDTTAKGSELTMEWDALRFVMPFTVK